MRSPSRPLNAQVIEEEVRFLLKTLTRDDLFGESVSLTEAEKLLESSLTVPFVEYCGILPRLSVVSIDRVRQVIAVTPRGREIARGANDPDFFATLIAHFAPRFEIAQKRAPTPPPQPTHVGPVPPPAPRTDPRVDVRHEARDIARARTDPRAEPRAETRHEPRAEPRAESRDDVGFARPPRTVVLDERYTRGDRLGEGSMGTVYRAHDLVLGRDVAQKVFDHVFSFVSYIPRETLVERLRAASLAMARLDHPAIVAVHDVSFDERPPHVVLALAPGGSLATRLAQRKASAGSAALPVDQALSVFVQVAHALAHAHANGVVHGGLTPENVLFDARGNARVSDFGFARVTEKPAGSTVPVYVGTGATSYMAPEQLHRGELTPAADVHALGILFYEMLTGELPGRRSPMPSHVAKGLDPTLDDVFDRMTRDRPEDRYEHAGELLAELAARVSGLAKEATHLVLHERDPFASTSPRAPEKMETTVVADEEEVASAEAEPLTTGEFQI